MCTVVDSPALFAFGANCNSKKISHNANERERRKKLNTLYTNLSLLLPHSMTKRKLSNPAIVCRVLKYIPELRREIGYLARQRQELAAVTKMAEKNWEGDLDMFAPNVDVFVSDSELFVNIQTSECTPPHLSSLLLLFEDQSLDLLNASMHVADARVLHSLQLRAMDGGHRVDAASLRLKILLLCERCRGRRFLGPLIAFFK